ncbi:hypothetical protein T4C_11133, partial [Trichinella pseudospiralis]
LDLRNNTDQLTNIQQVMGPARFLCAITADSFEVCLLFAVVVCVLESTETKCTKKR